MDSTYIQTYTNKKFHLLQPVADEVCIEDIAHALSMQCRFTGHTKFHYSVAQHAYYASLIVHPRFAFEALNHDDSEAYIGDMSRPMKHFTNAGRQYLLVEAQIEDVIAKKFNLPSTMSPEVKEADNLMLYAEKAQLMPDMQWDVKWGDTERAAPVLIKEWTPKEAEENFLHRFYVLQRVIEKIF